jgi:hypothetical protein
MDGGAKKAPPFYAIVGHPGAAINKLETTAAETFGAKHV